MDRLSDLRDLAQGELHQRDSLVGAAPPVGNFVAENKPAVPVKNKGEKVSLAEMTTATVEEAEEYDGYTIAAATIVADEKVAESCTTECSVVEYPVACAAAGDAAEASTEELSEDDDDDIEGDAWMDKMEPTAEDLAFNRPDDEDVEIIDDDDDNDGIQHTNVISWEGRPRRIRKPVERYVHPDEQSVIKRMNFDVPEEELVMLMAEAEESTDDDEGDQEYVPKKAAAAAGSDEDEEYVPEDDDDESSYSESSEDYSESSEDYTSGSTSGSYTESDENGSKYSDAEEYEPDLDELQAGLDLLEVSTRKRKLGSDVSDGPARKRR